MLSTYRGASPQSCVDVGPNVSHEEKQLLSCYWKSNSIYHLLKYKMRLQVNQDFLSSLIRVEVFLCLCARVESCVNTGHSHWYETVNKERLFWRPQASEWNTCVRGLPGKPCEEISSHRGCLRPSFTLDRLNSGLECYMCKRCYLLSAKERWMGCQ